MTNTDRQARDFNPIPGTPIELDLRVGGVWRQHMVIDTTNDYMTGGVYREIVPDEKLVFSWGATGGWPALDPDRLDDSPLVTVTLEQVGGHTEMCVRVDLPANLSGDGVQHWLSLGIRDGWRQTVDRLASDLARTATAA
jgi:uncharacterized protein YndB with AHSA1/START domain